MSRGKKKLTTPPKNRLSFTPKNPSISVPALVERSIPDKTLDSMLETAAEVPGPSQAEIMAAILDCKQSLSNQIGHLEEKFCLLQADVMKIKEQVKENTVNILTCQKEITGLKTANKELQTKVNKMEAINDSNESRLRRLNIRMNGLAERTEGPNCESCIEEILESVLSLSFRPKIESAYRVSQRQSAGVVPGRQPRTIIARFTSFQEKMQVLEAARKKGQLQYQGSTFQLFPDFTRKVQEQRQQFGTTKKKLREKKIQYSMQFPATLRIIYQGQTKFFVDSVEAYAFVEGCRNLEREDQEPGTGSGSGGEGREPGERQD